MFSQIEAIVNGPLSLTPSTEFLAAPNGVLCGDALNYSYTETLNATSIPNRIQYAGPTNCSNDIFGVPLFGQFVYLPNRGTTSTGYGPSLSYSVYAVCVNGELRYCWEAILAYSAISSSGQFPNADCNGNTWYLPNMPNGTNALGTGTRYDNTIGDETTTVFGVAWPISNGIAGILLYEMQIRIVKQGCSTDINDIPTSFTLDPEYNPAGITVDFTLS